MPLKFFQISIPTRPTKTPRIPPLAKSPVLYPPAAAPELPDALAPAAVPPLDDGIGIVIEPVMELLPEGAVVGIAPPLLEAPLSARGVVTEGEGEGKGDNDVALAGPLTSGKGPPGSEADGETRFAVERVVRTKLVPKPGIVTAEGFARAEEGGVATSRCTYAADVAGAPPAPPDEGQSADWGMVVTPPI